jgi:hypothetical protein
LLYWNQEFFKSVWYIRDLISFINSSSDTLLDFSYFYKVKIKSKEYDERLVPGTLSDGDDVVFIPTKVFMYCQFSSMARDGR